MAVARRFRVGYLDRPAHEAFDLTTRADPALSVERIPLAQPPACTRAGVAVVNQAGGNAEERWSAAFSALA
jgi:hypothetical protein